MWAIGCLMAEMSTGSPLFDGESDLDQLFHILRCFGRLTPEQEDAFRRNHLYQSIKVPQAKQIVPLDAMLPQLEPDALHFVKRCLGEAMRPDNRATCAELLQLDYFKGFREWFEPQLREALAQEQAEFELRPRKVRQERARELFPPRPRAPSPTSPNAAAPAAPPAVSRAGNVVLAANSAQQEAIGGEHKRPTAGWRKEVGSCAGRARVCGAVRQRLRRIPRNRGGPLTGPW